MNSFRPEEFSVKIGHILIVSLASLGSFKLLSTSNNGGILRLPRSKNGENPVAGCRETVVDSIVRCIPCAILGASVSHKQGCRRQFMGRDIVRSSMMNVREALSTADGILHQIGRLCNYSYLRSSVANKLNVELNLCESILLLSIFNVMLQINN